MRNQNLLRFTDSKALVLHQANLVNNNLHQLRSHVRHTVRQRKPGSHLNLVLFLNWLGEKTSVQQPDVDEPD
ncbi:MAG TPA: hypothetical protein PKA00_07970 [Saprospiraceae bacterium]|nr:hypothetical protein [Saprospiraceae bacterium]HMQ82829.1 hypothetical protein [Saprospiraceae bacterium]